MRGSNVHSLSDTDCHRIVGSRYRSDDTFQIRTPRVTRVCLGTSNTCLTSDWPRSSSEPSETRYRGYENKYIFIHILMSGYLTHSHCSCTEINFLFSYCFWSCKCNSVGEGDQNISVSSSSYSIEIVDQSGWGECKGTICALHDDYVCVGTISQQRGQFPCIRKY
jgi:hypothetical protein